MKNIWFILVLLGSVLASAPASAQRDAPMEALLEQVEGETKKVDRSPVQASSLSAVNLKVHWKLWKRVYSAQKSGTDELEALRHDGWSVGWVSQPQYAMAVAALAPSLDDPEEANMAFAGAEELAPQLPYPYLLHASYALRTTPADLPEWARAWSQGVRAGAVWPDTAFPWALKLLLYLLAASAAASLVFVVGQLLRNFQITAYDLARVMPRGFSSNQTALLLVALVVVPGLVMQSPLLSVLTTLAVVSFVQRPNERLISILAFGLIASLTYADDALIKLSRYPDSLTQRMVHAQWVTCLTGCQEEMNALAVRHPEEPYIRYTALLAAYRDGGPANMKRVVEEVDGVEWPGELIGYAHNLKGAALIGLGKPKKAMEVFQTAREELRDDAAPVFNMMRAHQMLDDADAASSALQEASSRDLDRVSWFLDLERRDTNSFVMVSNVPLPVFLEYYITKVDLPDDATSPIRPFWELLAGDVIALESTRLLGLGGIALVLLGFPLRRRTSTPCPRCGLARDPKDGQRTANHPYCYSCYSTFVTGATLDYDARVHNEKVLGRRERFQRMVRRFGGLLVPGLGHHSAGHAGTGFVLTVLVVFSALTIFNPYGVVRVAEELVSSNWSGQVTIAWIVFSVCVFSLLNIALRGLDPVDGRRIE